MPPNLSNPNAVVSQIPDLSVVIPVYNRGELIRYTLESVRRASVGLNVEIIVVDDGSTEPAADSIARAGYEVTRIIRQKNQGLLFARLNGFEAATGENVLFLDSDDLVSPQKFHLQLAAMRAAKADVSYSDQAGTMVEGDYEKLEISPHGPLEDVTNAAEFFIRVQPAPHCPIFHTAYLRDIVDRAFFPPSPHYNAVAEIWFYQNAAPRPGSVVRVAGPHTIVGSHPGARLTNHWERLAVASLGVMEAFERSCPSTTAEERHARALLGEIAFRSWRKLAPDFSRDFQGRELAVALRLMPEVDPKLLGGRGFQMIARLVGPVRAARVLKRYQTEPYAKSRTMDDATFNRLLATLPAP